MVKKHICAILFTLAPTLYAANYSRQILKNALKYHANRSSQVAAGSFSKIGEQKRNFFTLKKNDHTFLNKRTKSPSQTLTQKLLMSQFNNRERNNDGNDEVVYQVLTWMSQLNERKRNNDRIKRAVDQILARTNLAAGTFLAGVAFLASKNGVDANHLELIAGLHLISAGALALPRNGQTQMLKSIASLPSIPIAVGNAMLAPGLCLLLPIVALHGPLALIEFSAGCTVIAAYTALCGATALALNEDLLD